MKVSIIKSEAANEAFEIEQLKAIPDTERTPAQSVALTLHDWLVSDKQTVEDGIERMCQDLKEIRDGKYYETLGFGDFGEYTEQMHGIKARQAYNYIRAYYAPLQAEKTSTIISPDVMQFVKHYNYAYGKACEEYVDVPLGAVQDVIRNTDLPMNILPHVINELLDALAECSDSREKFPELFKDEPFEIR